MSESAPEKGSHSAMPDLGQKLGPLPAWGWGAIVVVAYLVWRHYAAGKAQSTGAGSTVPADANGVPSDALGGSGSASSGNGLSSGGFTDSTGAVINQTPTNQVWASSAIDALLASGKYTYADAVDAVDNYVLGNGSNATQRGIVNTAVGIVGKPPIPVPFVDVETPVAASTPDPTPAPPVVSEAAPVSVTAPAPAPVTVPDAPDNSAADLLAAQKAKEAVEEQARAQANQANKAQRVAAAKQAYDNALHNHSPASTVKRLYDAYWAVRYS